MEKARMLGMEQSVVVGGTEGGRRPIQAAFLDDLRLQVTLQDGAKEARQPTI